MITEPQKITHSLDSSGSFLESSRMKNVRNLEKFNYVNLEKQIMATVSTVFWITQNAAIETFS